MKTCSGRPDRQQLHNQIWKGEKPMCVICASKKGVRQPTESELRKMFSRNPDGAGYMCVRNGRVSISKGFMKIDDFLASVQAEHFSAADPVVYHFRISTQGGVQPAMTQPFPLTNDLRQTRNLSVKNCNIGVAHNGVIKLTTDHNDKEFSDTAHFIAEYLPLIVRGKKDLRNERVRNLLAEITNSKLAFLDNTGFIHFVGSFVTVDKSGLLFSNSYWNAPSYTKPTPTTTTKSFSFQTFTPPKKIDAGSGKVNKSSKPSDKIPSDGRKILTDCFPEFFSDDYLYRFDAYDDAFGID